MHGEQAEAGRSPVDDWSGREKAKNMKVLESVVETILLCGRQNIPLWGHRDDSQHATDSSINSRNFRPLLKYRVEGGDAVLGEQISRAPKNATCLF